MKIRPRNNILYAATGVKFSSANAGGANWRQLVFNNYRQHLLNLLTKYGEANDYGEWLNEMQHRHSLLWNAANQSGNWENVAYENENVGKYQQDYRGGKGNNGNYLRFGTILLNPEDNYDFNLTGIKTNLATRYDIPDPPRRTSGDFSREGYDFKVDNYYSGITDDRRLLGRKGDWDENSQEYKNWIKELNSRGWTMELDPSDQYYKLKRLGIPDLNNLNSNKLQNNPLADKRTLVQPGHNDKYGFDWNKLKEGALKILGNPDLYAVGRLAGNLINNERVYDEQLKGIKPVLRLTYNTHRQVVGDEATKQAYYRRAAQGETRAARPFTSDADRQVAYMNEAKRIGDELRAQGDLADNAEIRRTSDESNQHLWANTQRATEVANANLASINQANALKHNLLALKHSAQWSSIDNFLQGIEYRKRLQLAEEQALDDQIFALQLQQNLLYDDRINNAQRKLLIILDKHKNSDGTYDYNNQEVKDTIKEWKSILNLIAIENWREKQQHYRNRNTISFVKSGTKVTRKRKDDLLYKSTRDVVEHFRKMSKLSSDALDRKIPKIEKLTSHPKGKTRRYLLGGVAPFTVYKPVALGGETTTTTNTNVSSSRKGSDKDETLDMIKELFKLVAGKGLPSDVNSLYTSMLNFLQRAKLFGEDISTDDIASMYLSQMQLLNLILYLKSNYDKAEQAAISNDAINEFAVDYAGRLACQNTNTGEIEYASSLSDAKEKGLNPLTNGLLLQLRAVSPSLAGHSELDSVVANGIGMSKIALFLKSQLPSLGSSELTIEGYTKKGTNDIINGLKLLQEAPEGNYKYTHFTKDLQLQAAMAINYLRGILPSNMRQIIKTHAELGGLSEELLIGSLVSSNIREDERYELDAVTGKAAKDSNGNSKEKGDSDNSAGLAFVLGQGPRVPVVFNTGTSYLITANGIQGVLQNKSNENLGQGATLQDASKSLLGGYFLWNKATFGGSKLIPTAFNHIILNDSTVIGVDLPYRKGIDGNEIPDFLQLRRMEDADNEIRLKGILSNDYQSINLIYLSHLLPPKYDLNGKLIEKDYKRFAVVLATLDETSLLDKNAILSDEVAIANEVERDLYNETMRKITGDKKFELDDGWPIFGGGTKLYKGSIFIPYQEDIAFAALSSGKPFNTNLPNNSSTVQQMLYSPATLTYKPLDVTLSLIINN